MSSNLPAQADYELAIQQDKHQYELAKYGIEKNAENEQKWQTTFLEARKSNYRFIIQCLVCFLFFLGFIAWLGQTELASELIRAVVLVLGGGGAGYTLGYKKGRKQTNS